MKCAWQAYLNLVPPRYRTAVDEQGRENLQELRLRIGLMPELVRANGSYFLHSEVTTEDIQYCINAACKYSPWTAATAASGYIMAQGGHRIGLCGEATVQDGQMRGIRMATSLCMRVARDFPGIANNALRKGSVLIIGRPCSGKTTLLRDMIRIRSNEGKASVAVVDERAELFPMYAGGYAFPSGRRTDVLTGCTKEQGIEILLRTMGPGTIAVDEITEERDCKALVRALWCGVDLLATAHAGSVRELTSRPIYKPLIDSRAFKTVLVMQPDKSFREETIPL